MPGGLPASGSVTLDTLYQPFVSVVPVQKPDCSPVLVFQSVMFAVTPARSCPSGSLLCETRLTVEPTLMLGAWSCVVGSSAYTFARLFVEVVKTRQLPVSEWLRMVMSGTSTARGLVRHGLMVQLVRRFVLYSRVRSNVPSGDVMLSMVSPPGISTWKDPCGMAWVA